MYLICVFNSVFLGGVQALLNQSYWKYHAFIHTCIRKSASRKCKFKSMLIYFDKYNMFIVLNKIANQSEK